MRHPVSGRTVRSPLFALGEGWRGAGARRIMAFTGEAAAAVRHMAKWLA
jgi:hypothetical protein